MSEEKIIRTNTIVSSTQNYLEIFTYYVGGKFIEMFISPLSTFVDRAKFRENELGLRKDGYEDVEMFINSMGELVVKSDSNKDFTINSDGELIMEEQL